MAKSIFLKLIDDQITKQLKPFMESGIGPDGEECSDVVISPDGGIKVVNMIMKTEPLNQMLVKQGAAVRFAMMQAKRVALTIPWSNFSAGDWRFELEDLTMLLFQVERSEWNAEELERAKEASIEAALKGLITKMKSLTKKKGGGLVDSIKARILSGAAISVSIKNVHVRIERGKPSGAALPVSLGFVLPSIEVTAGGGIGASAPASARAKPKKGDANDDPELQLQRSSITIGRAGVYCSTGTALSLAIPDEPLVSNQDYDVDGDGSISKAEDRARQSAVFVQQRGMKASMAKIATAMAAWPDKDWLLICSLDDGTPTCIRVDTIDDPANKHEPELYTYDHPLKRQRVQIGKMSVNCSEAQLAALMGLGALGQDYKLWQNFAVARQRLQLPAADCPPNLRWRAAKNAVLASLAGTAVKTRNVAKLLMRAREYKRKYTAMLVETTPHLSHKEAGDIKARKLARSRLGHDETEALRHLEGELPIATLAWCRLVSIQKAKSDLQHRDRRKSPLKMGLGGGRNSQARGDDDDDDDEDDSTSKDILDAGPVVDPRVEKAPKGFITSVVDVTLGVFSLNLERTQTPVEIADAKIGMGMEPSLVAQLPGQHAATLEGTSNLMTMTVKGIRARMRKVAGVGAEQSVLVQSIDVQAGPAGVEYGPGIDTTIVSMVGDAHADGGVGQLDELLAGPVDYCGPIDAFRKERKSQIRDKNAGLLTRRFFGAGSEADDDEQDAAGALSPTSASVAPAVRVRQLKATPGMPSPDEMHVWMGSVTSRYLPTFFHAYEAFMHPVECAKWSSQLGHTLALVKRHDKICRSIDLKMREAWHKPEIQMMTAFLSFCDVFDEPSWRTLTDVHFLSPIRMQLLNEKNRDEILNIKIPPMAIQKLPKVGDPAPPTQSARITFFGAIEAHTAVEKKLLARVVQIQTKDSDGEGDGKQSASRLGGTRDVLIAETKALHAKIGHLVQEVEHLRVIYAGMKSRAKAAALANIDERADYDLPLPAGMDEGVEVALPEGFGSLPSSPLAHEHSRRGRQAKKELQRRETLESMKALTERVQQLEVAVTEGIEQSKAHSFTGLGNVLEEGVKKRGRRISSLFRGKRSHTKPADGNGNGMAYGALTVETQPTSAATSPGVTLVSHK